MAKYCEIGENCDVTLSSMDGIYFLELRNGEKVEGMSRDNILHVLEMYKELKIPTSVYQRIHREILLLNRPKEDVRMQIDTKSEL